MFRTLCKLFDADTTANRLTRRRPLTVQQLDRRDLPSSWLMSDGTLVIDDYAHVVRNEASVSQLSDGRIMLSQKDRETAFGASFETRVFAPGQVRRIHYQGGEGADKFTNRTSVPSRADGNGGNDTLIGGSGRDTLNGGNGSDSLVGGIGFDRLDGGAMDDTLEGGDGNDTLFGGSSADVLRGGNHNDILWGDGGGTSDTGNDTLHGGYGNDLLMGEAGNDKLYGDDVALITLGGNDTLRGGMGDDLLEGHAGNDMLYGDLGLDTLNGGYGKDMLFGGILDSRTVLGTIFNGRDALNGGPGSDRLLFDDQDTLTFDSADAYISFRHGTKLWHNAEVERVDAAFAILQNATGNTSLLKVTQGTLDPLRRMTFVRNSGTAVGFNDRGSITVTDLVMSGNSVWETGYLLHEIGHNWDRESTIWSSFLRINGWTQTNPNSSLYTRISKYGEVWWFRTGSQQASTYAMTHPEDDFAESFAAYFLQWAGLPWYSTDGLGAVAIPAKIALMGQFVASKR